MTDEIYDGQPLWNEPELPVDEISLAEFEKLVDDSFALRDEIGRMNQDLQEKRAGLDSMHAKITFFLEKHGKTKHAGRLGTVSLKVESYPTVPKDPVKRAQFFTYLKAKGAFEDLITVNHNTLRAFYKAEQEASGDPMFSVPGLEPFERKTISMRKG